MSISRSIKIDDIYNDDGYKRLSEAWNKSAWNRMEFDKATWMGVRTKQLLPDIYLLQEIVSQTKPDIILETGTGWGGTTLLLASLLFFLGGKKLITIDVEIENNPRKLISRFPVLFSMIHFIEGSSIDAEIILRSRSMVDVGSHVLLVFDAGHTRSHVLKELKAYSDLLQSGDRIIVQDTNMIRLSDAPRGHKQWITDSPLPAIEEFLKEDNNFEIDETYKHWNTVSYADGILRRK